MWRTSGHKLTDWETFRWRWNKNIHLKRMKLLYHTSVGSFSYIQNGSDTLLRFRVLKRKGPQRGQHCWLLHGSRRNAKRFPKAARLLSYQLMSSCVRNLEGKQGPETNYKGAISSIQACFLIRGILFVTAFFWLACLFMYTTLLRNNYLPLMATTWGYF